MRRERDAYRIAVDEADLERRCLVQAQAVNDVEGVCCLEKMMAAKARSPDVERVSIDFNYLLPCRFRNVPSRCGSATSQHRSFRDYM
jgi:hypothetical protein